MKLVLATKNRGKVREMASYLSEAGLEVVSMDEVDAPDVEETGETLEENARLKALSAARATGYWALGEDTGLEVDALGGAPGVRSARYAGDGASDEDNNAKLLRELQGVTEAQRTARFRTVMALASPDGRVWTTEGRMEGLILSEPRGAGGFGYDPLFFSPQAGRTLAELSVKEKDAVSHRGKALRAMLSLIRDLVEKEQSS